MNNIRSMTMFVLLCLLAWTQTGTLSSQMVQQSVPSIFIGAIGWSPQGNLIAFAGTGSGSCNEEATYEHNVFLLDSSTGSIYRTLEGLTCPVNSIAWNPDGTQLAAAGGSGLIVWDIDTGAALITQSAALGLFRVRWKPTGDELGYIWHPDFRFITLSLGTGQTTVYGQDPEFSREEIATIDWSPDGTRIVSGGARDGSINAVNKDGYVRIWDIASNTILSEWDHPGGVFHVDWKPDGTQIASGSGNGEIRLWDVATGQLVQTLSGDGGRFQWHLNRSVLAGASGGENSTIQVWNTETGVLIETYPSDDWYPKVAWSPLGGRLLFNTTSTIDVNTVSLNTFGTEAPLSSLDLLPDILIRCGITGVEAPDTVDEIPAFINQIAALPPGSVSEFCRDELVFVAEDVQSHR